MSGSAIAGITKKQIGVWALASVGARGFMHGSEGALYFDAKPRHRIVRVIVELTPADLYRIRVVNKKTGEELYRADGVYNDSLSEVILALPRNV